jgi:hypothetical protein
MNKRFFEEMSVFTRTFYNKNNINSVHDEIDAVSRYKESDYKPIRGAMQCIMHYFFNFLNC